MSHGLAVLLSAFLMVSCSQKRKHDFGDVDKWSKVFNSKARDKWQKPQHVIDLMQIKPTMTVAEIGAGTGYFLPYLSRDAESVLALDIEQSLVDFMNAKAEKDGLENTKAVLTSTDAPGIGDDVVDKVLIVNTWHHIDDRVPYAKKLLQSLKSSGEVYIVDFQPGKGGPGPKDKRRLGAGKVFRELEKAGFVASVIYEELPHQYMVRGKKESP